MDLSSDPLHSSPKRSLGRAQRNRTWIIWYQRMAQNSDKCSFVWNHNNKSSKFRPSSAFISIQYQYKAVLILILNSNSVLKRCWILNTCQAFIQIWGADCAFEPCVRTVHSTKASTQINTTTSLYCPSLLPPHLSIYLILLLYTIPTAINKLVTLYKSYKIVIFI